jgi:hypothetical protein
MLPGLSGIAGVGGRKVAAVTYQTQTFTQSVGTQFTFSSQAFGTASSDRVVIVSVVVADGTAGTVSAVTIGGVSATIIRQASDSTLTGAIVAAAVPTGTTGSVVVDLSTSRGACAIGIWSATGQVSAAGVASNSNTDLAELTLVAEDGGFVIGLCCNLGATPRTTTWSGASEDFDDVAEENTYHSGASAATSGTAVSLQPTLSGAASPTVFVAATF